MLQVFFAMRALVVASVHLVVSPKRRSGAVSIVETYLFYLLFIYVGLMGLFTAYYHVFRPIEASAPTGWSTSPLTGARNQSFSGQTWSGLTGSG